MNIDYCGQKTDNRLKTTGRRLKKKSGPSRYPVRPMKKQTQFTGPWPEILNSKSETRIELVFICKTKPISVVTAIPAVNKISAKNVQKCSKMHKILQKFTKTFRNWSKPVPKFVSRISYLVSRRSDLKKQTQFPTERRLCL